MNIHQAERLSVSLFEQLLMGIIFAITLLVGIALGLPDIGLLGVLVGSAAIYFVVRIRSGQRDIPAAWRRWSVGNGGKK